MEGQLGEGRGGVEARRVCERASGAEGSAFWATLDEPVPGRAIPFVQGMVERRLAGEPLQYVLGRWGFRRLELLVDQRVLIPRPETETVVDAALDEARRLGGEALVAVDLGTGSGAIALALACELPRALVWGTDRSPEALAVARANLAGAGGRVGPRVRLVEGSWFEPLPSELRGRVQLVVANPPYVAGGEHLPAEVSDWEPRHALVAGPTGLEALTEVVSQAPEWLAHPGALVVEHAPHQAEAVATLAREVGFGDVTVHADLAGRDRMVVART